MPPFAARERDEAESPLRSRKAARVEAALLVVHGPISAGKLARVAQLTGAREARETIDWLNRQFDRTDSAFRIERVASGYRMLTRPCFAFWLDQLHAREVKLKLSAAVMETLAIIAYRQPLTRADIEAVRGVQSIEMVKQLLERSLVQIVGEDDSLGRPYLYGTTKRFLELFGLQSLDELPHTDKLRPPQSDEAAAEETEEDDVEPDATVDDADAADEPGADDAVDGDDLCEEEVGDEEIRRAA